MVLLAKILRRRPLWLQLIVALCTTLLVVNLLMSSQIRQMVSDFAFKQVDQQSESAFGLLASSMLDAVISEDIPLLNTIASQALETTSGITGLIVENEKSVVLVEKRKPHNKSESDIRDYRYPVDFAGEHFGSIVIQWDIKPIEQEIYSHAAKLQFFSSAMLVLLTCLSILLLNWLAVRPIRLINRRLDDLQKAEDQPSPLQLPESSSLELMHLAAATNELSKAIQQKNQREKELIDAREALQVAHDEALRANQAKSSFLATMSHEIRTPMNAVLGIFGMLKDTSLNKKQQQLIKTGRSAGEQLLAIINNILDFTKMETGELHVEKTEFNLLQLFSSCVDLFSPQAQNTGIQLDLDLEPELPYRVKGYPDQLRQVLINLIGNAIKFTPEGCVSVRARANDLANNKFRLYCTVQDTGIGIGREHHRDLFKEFTMVDPSHSRTHEGTGLGLAICYRLVSLMQGELDFRSERGKGSTFFFHVDLETVLQNKPDTASLHELAYRKPAPGLRVLLVEDNPANQMVIKHILESVDLQVDVAANGLEALQAIKSLPYDVILMDISMPEMDGLEATRLIRKLPGEKGHISVIALTAHALEGDKERFIEAGMDGYVTKPVDRDNLLNKIAVLTQSFAEANHRPTPEDPSPQLEIPIEEEPLQLVDKKVLEQLGRDTSPELIPKLLKVYI
ncbi:MAG: response regulator, partial [Proteobacteria bacterium]|nr:response regulator [Pseudomonadota bacterium]